MRHKTHLASCTINSVRIVDVENEVMSKTSEHFDKISEKMGNTYNDLHGLVEENDEICEDSPEFANCDLIVKSGFCDKSPYSEFCCKSCADAASGGDNSEAEENEEEGEGDDESEGN